MTIDFHIHSKLTKRFPFRVENFNHYIEEAKNENINCIAFTEHCHANNFEEAYQYLENNYKYENGYYLVNGIKVFIGIEITTSMKLDILFVGNKKDVFRLRDLVMDHKKENDFIDIRILFEVYDLSNMLVILAHPYRRYDEFPKLPDFVLDKIDAMEYNASDLYDKGIEIMKGKIEMLSQKVNIPAIAGSDSHYFLQLGSVKTIIQDEIYDMKEIKRQIRQRKFRIEISDNLALKVRASKIIKELKIKNNDMG